MAHTITLMVTTIVIGYSLFTVTIIRSSAGTPMNEYQPDNPYTLIRYLGREQYGSTPIIYGQSFNSPYEIQEKPYYTPLDGKYYHATNVDATFPSSAKMLFPRMWNAFKEEDKAFYKSYVTKYKTRRAMVYGRGVNFQEPSMADNLRFFFDYQVNHMYVRYFLWNFVGRQNDIHSDTPGDLSRGNWESGIKFIDQLRLGDQSEGPDFIVHNRGKNHYFFLPLILGLIGFFFQLRHDPRNSWVTGLLFLLTGLAIVVYLNQNPFQVRERDYAYAGSFYVFALWTWRFWSSRAAENNSRKYQSMALHIVIVVQITLMWVPGLSWYLALTPFLHTIWYYLGGMAMTALAVYNLLQYRKLPERTDVLPNGKKPVW